MRAGIRIPHHLCPLPDAQCEARNRSTSNVDRLGPFRTQKIGVHEQSVEKDVDATKVHECVQAPARVERPLGTLNVCSEARSNFSKCVTPASRLASPTAFSAARASE